MTCETEVPIDTEITSGSSVTSGHEGIITSANKTDEDKQGGENGGLHYVPDDKNGLLVEVRDASKSYGSTKAGTCQKVLNGFSMRVPKGAIYSLLGSSGCGKTTALSCIVGLRSLDEGTITVFGHSPGSPESGVPGRNVGYMPQDLCLYEYLSVVETLQYFGQIYGMPDDIIEDKIDFLVKLLNLEEVHNHVDTLSGGQKRRASFAIALLHTPKLLILDEPTVGVDPVLRERIWSYLKSLTNSHEVTVVITTHYVEEARMSSMVGLMGNGKLLYENSPETLLRQTGARLLGDAVFLVYQRCENLASGGKGSLEEGGKEESQQNGSVNHASSTVPTTTSLRSKYACKKSVTDPASRPGSSVSLQTPLVHNPVKIIRSLLKRNYLQMTRNLWYLFVLLVLPGVQVLSGIWALGANPHGIKVGIVNQEMDFNVTGHVTREVLEGCAGSWYSCRYLNFTSEDDILLYPYKSEEEAIRAVKSTEIPAYIHIPANFTEHFKFRILWNNNADNLTLEGSQIHLRRDMTDVIVALRVDEVLFTALQKFLVNLLNDSSILPLNFSRPAYGSPEISHQSYMAAGSIIVLASFFPICTISMHIIADISRGTMERTLVAGVKKKEVLLGEIITHGLYLIVQTTCMYLIVAWVSEIKIQGSIILSALLAFECGLIGLSLGFVLPLFCKKEVEAMILTTGLILPDMILGGLCWPVEFMPKWLSYFGYCLPHTLAGISMRAIFTRGWGFFHPHVWPGFLAPLVWILLSWMIIWRYNVFSK